MKLHYRDDSHLYGWSSAFGRNIIFTLTLIALGLSVFFQDKALGLAFADVLAAAHIG